MRRLLLPMMSATLSRGAGSDGLTGLHFLYSFYLQCSFPYLIFNNRLAFVNKNPIAATSF
jgi:hypothetical protein